MTGLFGGSSWKKTPQLDLSDVGFQLFAEIVEQKAIPGIFSGNRFAVSIRYHGLVAALPDAIPHSCIGVKFYA